MTSFDQFELEVGRTEAVARDVRDLLKTISVGNCPLLPCEDCELLDCAMRHPIGLVSKEKH